MRYHREYRGSFQGSLSKVPVFLCREPELILILNLLSCLGQYFSNMNIAEQIAENLLKREAVRVSMNPPFTWTSGIKSPIYCDNRKMIAFVEERRAVVEAFVAMVREKGGNPDVIGGTATAAIPWAAFVAYEMDLSMIYIRPEKKEHGAGKQIEGYLEPGKKVLIIEDLISTGGSSVNAAEAVRNEGGCVVEDVFAIVTYQMAKAEQAFDAANLRLSTLTDFTTLMARAKEMGNLSEEELAKVLEFGKDPAGWGEKMGF